MVKKLTISNKEYFIYPIYNLYAANDNGEIIHIVQQKPMKVTLINNGNMKVTLINNGNMKVTLINNGNMKSNVSKHSQKGQKTLYVHRFIWECFNDTITDGKVIDHINIVSEMITDYAIYS